MALLSALKSPASRAFFSFVIGLALAVLVFHRPFSIQKTLAMPVREVVSRIVSHGNKCYAFHAEDIACEKI